MATILVQNDRAGIKMVVQHTEGVGGGNGQILDIF